MSLGRDDAPSLGKGRVVPGVVEWDWDVHLLTDLLGLRALGDGCGVENYIL